MTTSKRKPQKIAPGLKTYILFIDKDDHKKLKIKAAGAGVSMKKYINDLIKADLSEDQSKPA